MRGRFTNIKWLAVFAMIAGCSDKYASLVAAAPEPRLFFDRDTIVVREKDYSFAASALNPFIKLYAVPSPPQMHLSFTDSSGRVRFMYRSARMEDGKPIVVAGDSTLLFCACDTAGWYAVDVYLTDHLGKTASRQLMIRCIANERPVAGLTVSFLDSSLEQSWRYRLDASASGKPYGLIRSYLFAVDGVAIHSFSSFINVTFHQRGEHSVSLSVSDDLGAVSDTLTQKILIP